MGEMSRGSFGEGGKGGGKRGRMGGERDEGWERKVIGVVWWESYTPPAAKIKHLFHNPAPS